MKVWLRVSLGDDDPVTQKGDSYSIIRTSAETGTEETDIRQALMLARDAYMELKAALERRLPPQASSRAVVEAQ